LSLDPGPVSAQSAAPVLPAPEHEVFQQDLAWSPEGRWIAFSEYDSGPEYRPERWAIHVIGADGSGRRKIAERALYVTWAPDGKRLAFGSTRDGNPEIYTVGADGADLRRLTDHAGRDHLPAWSWSTDRIAFCSDRDGNQEIYLMRPDGSGLVRLTRDPAKDYNPAWSPDGGRVVFFREKGDGMDQIHVVEADGSKEWPITRDESNNVFPSFLPDGRIGFSSKAKDGREALVHVAPDGSGRTTVGEVPAFFARWSPDGSRIAFISGEAWPRSAIYLMRPDGSEIRKLVN
jgi:TolB protein